MVNYLHRWTAAYVIVMHFMAYLLIQTSQMFCPWHVGAPCYNLWVRASLVTIFHMRVQYVCVIRNVHVEYTDQLIMHN